MTASTGWESICKNNGNNDTKALQHYFFTPANNGQKEQEANPFLNTSFWQMGRVLWSIHVKKQQHISQTSSLWVIATSTSDQPTSKLHPVSQAWAKKVHVDFVLILYPNVPVYPRELRAFFFFNIYTKNKRWQGQIKFTEQGNWCLLIWENEGWQISWHHLVWRQGSTLCFY